MSSDLAVSAPCNALCAPYCTVFFLADRQRRRGVHTIQQITLTLRQLWRAYSAQQAFSFPVFFFCVDHFQLWS